VAFSGNHTDGEPTNLANDLGKAELLGLTQDGTLYYTIATNSIDVYTAAIDTVAARLLSGPDNVVKRYRGSFNVPSFSADGLSLAFMSRLDLHPRLWVYSRETGRIRVLDPPLASFQRPQWDPSGNRIFVLGSDRSRQGGIFRIDANTGATELAVDRRALPVREGAWAKDGRTLFDVFGANPNSGIFRIDTQTGQRQLLYVPPANVNLGQENLTLSPDGKTLAFQGRDKGTSSLMIIPTTGGPARTLLTLTKPETFPYGSFAWTADSTQILAVRMQNQAKTSAAGPVSELWLIDVYGQNQRKIDFPAMHIRQLRMSGDGRTIAFTAGETSAEVWVAENLLKE
jgi:Tol biopolymer transport system component